MAPVKISSLTSGGRELRAEVGLIAGPQGGWQESQSFYVRFSEKYPKLVRLLHAIFRQLQKRGRGVW